VMGASKWQKAENDCEWMETAYEYSVACTISTHCNCALVLMLNPQKTNSQAEEASCKVAQADHVCTMIWLRGQQQSLIVTSNNWQRTEGQQAKQGSDEE